MTTNNISWKTYRIPSPISITNPIFLSAQENTYCPQVHKTLILRDAPTMEAESEEMEFTPLERQFNDYYQLFLTKIARLPQEEAPTTAQEKRLIRLFEELLRLKRQIKES